MRKIAPAFILTSIVALTSGSALALGDMNKDKKSPNAGVTSTQSATAQTDKNYPAATSPANNEARVSGNGTSAAPVGTGASTSMSGNTAATTAHGSDKHAQKAACKGLTASEAAYTQHKCGELAVQANASKGGPASGGEGSGAAGSAGGSSSSGASGSGK